MRPLVALRSFAFIVISALVMVVSSERIFWYYTDAGIASFVELALFYGFAVWAMLWFVERHRATDFWSFFLAVPIFGYVVEGVITPVIYSGGPNPFFPLWFTGWHGLLGPVLLWYLVRRWAIQRRWRPVLIASIGLGAFWGTWAMTMWLPESLNDPDLAEVVPAIRSAGDFALYAAITGAVLLGSHLLLGALWVPRLGRSKFVERSIAVLFLAVVAAYTIALPWALPMFLGLIWTTRFFLKRHLQATTEKCRRGLCRPTVLEELAAPISLPAVFMLLALPATAAAVYAGWTAAPPGEQTIRVFYYSTIAAQTAAAAGAMIWSFVRVLRQ